MKYQRFSRKQLVTLNWWNMTRYRDKDAIICDGSVRSGKTLSMAVGFVLWSMSQFDGQMFGICGKTIESLRRNVVLHLPHWLEGLLTISEKRSENLLTISGGGHTNRYFLFGGRDESSYMLIQGMTLAGVYFDEVALMPESFVNQAIARCSVSGSRFWFNCNPESPSHWFYQQWILKLEDKNALHLHFTMDDNLSLPNDVRERYKSQFTGVFYERYILGRWKAAEGVIYRQFADNPERFIIRQAPQVHFAVIGVDFGGNGSAHAFNCTGFLPGMSGLVTLEEYYRKQIIDPAKLEEDFVDFVRKCMRQYHVAAACCDSAEQTLIQGFRTAARKAGIALEIRNAVKGPIIDRIRFYCRMQAIGAYQILEHCKHTIEAFQTAVWDSKYITEDRRLDDGSSNIDSLDAAEYAVEPYMQSMTVMR